VGRVPFQYPKRAVKLMLFATLTVRENVWSSEPSRPLGAILCKFPQSHVPILHYTAIHGGTILHNKQMKAVAIHALDPLL
jgi:hypothetical protein